MFDGLFESHLLEAGSLPLILHLDTIDNSAGTYNWHPNIEILYVVEGGGNAHIGDVTITAGVGDILIVNSDLLHGFNTDNHFKYYCLIPDRDFCAFNGIDTDSIHFAEKITDAKATALYKAVLDGVEDKTEYRDASVKSALMNLLVYLAKNHTEAVSNQTAKGNEGIKHALGYIRSHLSQKLTIETLCEQAVLSKYYFVREFKKNIGDTPIVYINKLRCERAKKMLAKGELSIGRIAEDCGFESISYFGKMFKRYTGLTPGEYSKKSME